MVQRSFAGFVGAAVLVASLVAGCDHKAKTSSSNAKTYSRSEVRRAFRSQGFDLGPTIYTGQPYELTVAPTPEITKVLCCGAAFWIPKRERQDLVMLLFRHTGDADDAVQALRRPGYRDEFDAQKGNVVVTNDGPQILPSLRKRIRNALAQLGQ
jgi:hypothetical protein